MELSKEIKTAVLAIASILLFIWGYSFLKGRDLFTSYKTLYVKYDNVEGLAASAPITLNGLVIGKISSITLENTTGKSIVELQINTDFPIAKSSQAKIYEPSLIGGKQIQIIPALNDKNLVANGDYLKGDNIPGLTTSMVDKLEPLQVKAEKMLVSTDDLVKNLNSVLDSKNKENIAIILENLKKTLAELKEASASANDLILENKSKINSTLSNIDKVSSDFTKVSDSLAKANLGKTVKDLEKTLANVDKIMTDIQAGKGTVGKLVKDDALYINFAKTSKELELLLQDMRLYPNRYINVSLFGKSNRPYKGPPAQDTITSAKAKK